MVATGVARGEDLAHASVPPGTVMAAADGHIVAVGPSGIDLSIWSDEGVLLGRHRLPGAGSRGGPIGLAIRGGAVLVAYTAGDERNIDAVSVDLARGFERGRFTVPQYPSRLAAAPDGWLFERLAPGESPVLTVVDDAGRVVRVLEPPPGLVPRATRAFGDASVAFIRPITVAGALWAVPSLAYELWSLSPAQRWRRVEVPACLAVSARRVEGDLARRRMQQQADQAPVAERRHLEERIEWTRRMNLRVSSYVTAARAVSARGDLLLVLTEPFPERTSGACRLDVWRPGDGRVVASTPVPGDCPSFVALAASGAWIRQGGRLTLLPIPLPGRDGPCGT